MLRIVKHGDPVQATSQYTGDVTDLIPVTFVEEGSSNGNDGLALIAKATGKAYAGLGASKQVTLSVKTEFIGDYAVGTIIPNLHINREWTDENPYPKAVDDKGKPRAETKPITHPDYGVLDLYSRTFISEEKVADTFNLVHEYEVVDTAAPAVK